MGKSIFKVFLILSTISFYYMILPTSILTFILWAIVYIVIGIPLYLSAFYLQVAIIRTLRKKSKICRKLIITPPRY